MSSLERRSRIVSTLQSVYRKDMGTINDVPALLEQCLEQDAWREFRGADGELVTYQAGEFEKFLRAKPLKGLGATPEGVLAILRASGHEKLVSRVVDLLAHVPLSAHGEVGNGRVSRVGDTNSTSGENDVPYVVRRLKRDAPEIAAQVAAGTVSPNRAAVMAGIRHGYLRVRTDDVDRALAKLMEFYTPDEIRGALKRAGR